MTDTEFIEKLTHDCDTDDFRVWLEWNWEHPQLRELSNEPQFRDWFNKAFNDDGHSETDEHYAYCGETEIDKELGGRLSWLRCLNVLERPSILHYRTRMIFSLFMQMLLIMARRNIGC